VSDPGGVSPGEIGGVFAGIIALLVALGKGFKWLLNWNDARAQTRSAKLDAWHRELIAEREKLDEERAEYQARVEERLKILERRAYALWLAFKMVEGRLRKVDPDDIVLVKADELLAAAFPLDPVIPPDMSANLGKID
jgi:hypothetical protein